MEKQYLEESGGFINEQQWKDFLAERLNEEIPHNLLLVPPDFTRGHSFGGVITQYIYERMRDKCNVRILPAVGTHMQMTAEEKHGFFGPVPEDVFLEHDWRRDNVDIGRIPGEAVSQATGGRYDRDIDIQIDRRLVSGEYDKVISIGQVVPHEVAGMSNYSKNILVGLGGRNLINKSHMIGALCGIETILGNVDSPVRAIFDYGEECLMSQIPLTYILTVTAQQHGETQLQGLYMGRSRKMFKMAACRAAKSNITRLPEKVRKMVVYLDRDEFKSTWVGNKAIYRTRMAIADGGWLLVIAPGLKMFGENETVDAAIRQYGYCGTKAIMELYGQGVFENLEMVSAHLIHSSSDGRFNITYATNPECMPEADVRKAGYGWMPLDHALKLFHPEDKSEGYYTSESGEEFYFIKSPAIGLWKAEGNEQ